MGVQPGDVVRLGSGGAAMTVESLAEGRAHCVWQVAIDGRWETRRDSFPLAALATGGGTGAGGEEDDPGYKVYEEGDD